MSYHTENCTYSWNDGLPDPSTYERQSYHWHITEGDKAMVEAWVNLNHYTDMFIQPDAPDKFWAYPPQCDMPEPIELSRVQEWFKNGGHLEVQL